METITLTASEIELIENSRKQAILEAEAQELRNKARIENDIKIYEKEISDIIKSWENQNKAATAFAESLGEGWSILINQRSAKKQIKSIVTDEIQWEKEYSWQIYDIVNGSFKIEVKEHITWGAGFYGKKINNGFKMFLTGPGIDWTKVEANPLKLTSSVNKKVEAYKEQVRYEAERKAKKASATETNVSNLRAAFPEAIIESGKDSERHLVTSTRYEHKEINVIVVKFANGVTMKFKVYEDGTLGRIGLDFGKVIGKDAMSLMVALRGI